MSDLIKNTYKMSIIFSLFFIVIGLMLFIDPVGFVALVSYLLAALFLTYGITNIIKYIKEKEFSYSKPMLVLGTILIIIGLFLFINPTFIGAIVPTIIGVCLIINSIEKIMWLKYTSEVGSTSYMVSFISGIVALLAGILLLFNPLAGTAIIIQIIGIIIIVYAVLDLIEKMKFKSIVTSTKKIDKSAKIIDEK